MGYIPTASLENLRKYQYKSTDKSLVSRYVLNPFWTWLVTLAPLNVAPNTITLTGLSIVFLNFFTLLYYDPLYLTEKGGATGPPNWVYFTWAIGLFAYQSLDAIDGKQARRTGMAGPLGEMFDHGCDALNTTLEVILAAEALNLGRSWWTVASQIATLANFYLTTWEEYHTGQLYLGVFSGPVEGILIVVLIYIITGFFGPSFWDQKIFTFLHVEHLSPFSQLPNLPLNESFMVFAGFGLAFNIVTSYSNVCLAARQRALSRPIYSTANGTSIRKTLKEKPSASQLILALSQKTQETPLLLLMPFVVSAAIQLAWLSQPEFNNSRIINSPAFVPFLCAWGLQFAHQVGRMILAHVTSGPFPRWDWIWVWSVVGAVDANLPNLIGRSPIIQTSLKNTTIFVWITLVVSFFTYTTFVTLVIKDITEFLGIACFTVRKKGKDGVWRKEKL